MPQGNPRGSVGRVETRRARIPLPPEGFRLECGETLPELEVAYETYGELTPEKDNAVFVCHALSGDAHVAGYHDTPENSPGWWDEMIGPGKGIDTNYYYVICANILGGCKGTTGPSSINPRTGRPYGSSFPLITTGDVVAVHRLLVRHLGIERLAAVVGGSYGGMQAMEWALRYPEMVGRCICVASGRHLSAQALAFDIVGRKVILSDPDWQGGDYYLTGRRPARGLAQARMIGHITYLSPGMMEEKFGRERRETSPGRVASPAEQRFATNFQVERYLDYQGEKFVARFDANSYLHITHAMDEYDLCANRGCLENALRHLQARVLVVALSDDWLFPPEQSVELAHGLLAAGRRVSYFHLHAPHGHDAFLVDIAHLAEVIRAFLPWVRGSGSPVPSAEARRDFPVIGRMIRPGARVVDLGCGNGDLLTFLAQTRGITGIGVDRELDLLIETMDKGHDVFQADLDAGLAVMPDAFCEYAILSQTLQEVRNPRLVLCEMLRVAREGIVIFPNAGHWRHRIRLGFGGRIVTPREREAQGQPRHPMTWRDFQDICAQEGIRVLEAVPFPASRFDAALLGLGLANVAADQMLVRMARRDAFSPGGLP